MIAPGETRQAEPVARAGSRALAGPVIAAAEWTVGVRARRLFMFNVLVPAGLVAAVALGGAPRQHAALVYTVLFTFFGVFGSAIPLVRDAATGLLARILLTGIAPARFVIERIAAQAALDLVQLAPALLIIGAAGNATAGTFIAAAAALATCLLAANAIGFWVAAAARSIAEAALFGATLALLMLHASGVFRTPAPGSVAAAIEIVMPFRALHHGALALAGAHADVALVSAAITAVAILAVTAALAAPLAQRLARAAE